MKIKCGGLTFISNFDSGNLARVVFISSSSKAVLSSKSDSISNSSSWAPNKATKSLPTKACCNKANEGLGELKKGKRKKSLTPSPEPLLFSRHATSSTKPIPQSFLSTKSTAIKSNPVTARTVIKTCEFQLWTKPDCAGTPFENSFRSWFHFGIEGGQSSTIIQIHIMNLNRQGKLYFYGMNPVYKIVPGKDDWKRIPGDVNYKTDVGGNFVITFSHLLPNEPGSVVYFAFTYPFPYTDCQKMLEDIDTKVGSSLQASGSSCGVESAIYYSRELLCYSLDGRRIDVLTITSFRGITENREAKLPSLFPDDSKPRCHIFSGKKVVFLSSRVHPGETPSSFVFNGFLRRLLCSNDQRSKRLRHLFVFKLIPMLNPDGVYRGHFRTDSRGMNLNRTYLIADPKLHPSVHGARSLLMYYHDLYAAVDESLISLDDMADLKVECDKPDFNASVDTVSTADSLVNVSSNSSQASNPKPSCSSCEWADQENLPKDSAGLLLPGNCRILKSLNCSDSLCSGSNCSSPRISGSPTTAAEKHLLSFEVKAYKSNSDLEPSDAEEERICSPVTKKVTLSSPILPPARNKANSGIAYYIDLHGHACKRGCFIYGNYFQDIDQKVECMLLAKLISINSSYFDFPACNFTEENMHSGSKREGQSKEGSGRVAFYTLTGNIHSYTLECNYNCGRNPAQSFECKSSSSQVAIEKATVYFTPSIYEQVGEALLISLLDASGHNPQSKLLCSPFGSLEGVKSWLRKYAKAINVKKRASQSPKRPLQSTKVAKKVLGDKIPPTRPNVLNKKIPKKFEGPRPPKLVKKPKMSILNIPSGSDDLLTNLKSSYIKPAPGTALYTRSSTSKGNLNPVLNPPKKVAALPPHANPKMPASLTKSTLKKGRVLLVKKKKSDLSSRPASAENLSAEKLKSSAPLNQNKTLSGVIRISKPKRSTMLTDQPSSKMFGLKKNS